MSIVFTPMPRARAALLVTVACFGAIALSIVFLEAFGADKDTRADKSTVLYSIFMGTLWLITMLVLAFSQRAAQETNSLPGHHNGSTELQ